MKRQQHDQALRFSAAFHQRRRRLTSEQPGVDSIGEGTVGELGAAPGRPAASVAEPAGLPSFMVATPGPPPGLRPAEPSSVPVPAAPVAAPVARRPGLPLGTMFDPGTPVTPTAALPFVEGSASDAVQSALAHAKAVSGPKPGSAPSSLRTTAPANERLAAIARAVPFSPSAGSPAAPEPPAAPAAPSSPAATPSASDKLALSLERHASVHVELELYPGQAAAVLQRYGLGAEQYASLDAGWRARMTRDPALQDAWEEARSAYRAWLAQQRPR